MNVIFVSYDDFNTPSGMHIFHLANALSRQGVRCVTYTPGSAASAHRFGTPLFRVFDRLTTPRRLLVECGFTPKDTVIHAWTPREIVRHLTGELKTLSDFSVVIHMEDNEEAITGTHLETLQEAERNDERIWRAGMRFFAMSHPARHREFLAAADGYTCIIESLLDYKPEGVPGHVFWPSCEPEVFDIPAESSPEEKAKWGIRPEEKVVFYPGNLHPNNADEVIQLYAAVTRLREAGVPVRIIKFGQYDSSAMAVLREIPALAEGMVDLTDAITPAAVPTVMRAADYLVQPGRDDAFNRYRFPSKLPLFMASARPVILPRSNLGEHLVDGKNCLLLGNGDSCTGEIADKLRFLINAPQTARAIGAAGREFAKEHFSWKNSAKGLKAFYAKILAERNVS